MNSYMEKAVNEAEYGSRNGEGGPFGAVIVDKDGKLIAEAHNQVLLHKDPTAHAEVQAIRKACKVLDTYDLSGCILYTSCEPCPMCLSAIIWSNIKEVYYACTREDAGNIGFRDDAIYEYLEGKGEKLLKIEPMDRDNAIGVFEKYQQDNKTIY